jgi:hypothetical protein
MADEALSGWGAELQRGVDIAVAAVVGADLETEIETEMMRGEGRADDGLLRGDGPAQTVHNIYYCLGRVTLRRLLPWITQAEYMPTFTTDCIWSLSGFLMKQPNISKETLGMHV